MQGMQVETRPWRAILNQEGDKKRMWTEMEVKARLEKGYAKWAAP